MEEENLLNAAAAFLAAALPGRLPILTELKVFTCQLFWPVMRLTLGAPLDCREGTRFREDDESSAAFALSISHE